MSPQDSISQLVPADKITLDVASLHLEENGFSDAISSLDPERAVHDYADDIPIKVIDEHLIEFSEALRTIAKALRRVTEGKASAEAEAAFWKRKYEVEKAWNLCLKQKGKVTETLPCDSIDENLGNEGMESVVHDISPDKTERCCGKDDICSHEILRDGALDIDSTVARLKVARKASFKLAWGCNGDKSAQHKHEIVSFERGNITTAERSSKQILLKWESQPQTVLILTKPNSKSVRSLCVEMVRWLKEEKRIDIFVEPRVKIELLTESSNFSFVHSWENDDEIKLLHTKVDLVVTLGGDGTVLWAASMFKGPVPPFIPFSLGSLGFMTPFHSLCKLLARLTSLLLINLAESENYREYLDTILKGPISITLRHRLQCHVIRDSAKDDQDMEEPILVLNEVTIDRGISAYLTYLECYCDNSFVTCVQGDGLIISTTSGSTAYSLAAGGSMVHPQVPGILFTPICPHSLSFRPLILPEYVTLRVQVPFNSRGQAWASFDGKDRMQLAPGDALLCSMAPWPVPTACQVDSTNDFLRSIHEGLHWNLRKTQSFDGPRD